MRSSSKEDAWNEEVYINSSGLRMPAERTTLFELIKPYLTP